MRRRSPKKQRVQVRLVHEVTEGCGRKMSVKQATYRVTGEECGNNEQLIESKCYQYFYTVLKRAL